MSGSSKRKGEEGKWMSKRQRVEVEENLSEILVLENVDVYLGGEENRRLTGIEAKIPSLLIFFKEAQTLAQFEPGREAYYISAEELCSNRAVLSVWKTVETDLEFSTFLSLSLLSLALYNLLRVKRLVRRVSERSVVVRLLRFTPLALPLQLNQSKIGRLVSVEGRITKLRAVQPLINWIKFQCESCSESYTIAQVDGIKVGGGGCRICDKSIIKSLHEESGGAGVSCYRLIQISCSTADKEVPNFIEVFLREEMAFRPEIGVGDEILVSGILRMRNGIQGPSTSLSHTLKDLYVRAVGLKNYNDSRGERVSRCLGQQELRKIKLIHEAGNIFERLIDSLCPPLHGLAQVKAGLLLALFGGSSNGMGRSEINVLLIGDPGLGKSQLLRSISNLSPRNILLSGPGCSEAGLTIAIGRDGDGLSLEPGALVLAHKAICCIDEFDKMTAHHGILLEAMEQQSVSIAKSGIVKTMEAKTTVVAAANPIGGIYKTSQNFFKNVKMIPALVSRFDLIFILRDRHEKLTFTQGKGFERADFPSTNNSSRIPSELLSLYIDYARTFVCPSLSEPAKELLRQFYVECREGKVELAGIQPTIRLLPSLIRLSQARAKLELSQTVSRQHAQEAIDIFKSGLALCSPGPA